MMKIPCQSEPVEDYGASDPRPFPSVKAQGKLAQGDILSMTKSGEKYTVILNLVQDLLSSY